MFEATVVTELPETVATDGVTYQTRRPAHQHIRGGSGMNMDHVVDAPKADHVCAESRRRLPGDASGMPGRSPDRSVNRVVDRVNRDPVQQSRRTSRVAVSVVMSSQ